VACRAALDDHPASGRGQLGAALLQAWRRRDRDAARAADPFPVKGQTGYCQDAEFPDAEQPGPELQEVLRWNRDGAAGGQPGLGRAALLGVEPASAQAKPAVELPVLPVLPVQLALTALLAQLAPTVAQPAQPVRRLPSVLRAGLPAPQRAPQQQPVQLRPARRRPSWRPPSSSLSSWLEAAR
jgi:hypothetical protein